MKIGEIGFIYQEVLEEVAQDASNLAGISLVGDRHRLRRVSRGIIINVTGRR